MIEILSKDINFLDFDRTINIEHTFGLFCIDNFPSSDFAEEALYALGKIQAQSNLKNGVPLKHDANHLSAIATYHNNPHFIAGFMAESLGKKLTFIETLYSEEPTTAVNAYAVEGTNRPFLISYIPDTGDDFDLKIDQLNDKNKQIIFLRQILLEKQQISEDAIIDFYDDDKNNYQKAQQLPCVNSHYVDGDSSHFTVLISRFATPSLKVVQPLSNNNNSIEANNKATKSDSDLVFQYFYNKPVEEKAKNDIGFMSFGTKGQVKSDLFDSLQAAKDVSHGLKKKIGLGEKDTSIKVFESENSHGFFRVVIQPSAVEKIKAACVDLSDEIPQVSLYKNFATFMHFKSVEKIGEDELDSLIRYVHLYRWYNDELKSLGQFVAEKCSEIQINNSENFNLNDYFITSIKPHANKDDLFTMTLQSEFTKNEFVINVPREMILKPVALANKDAMYSQFN